MGICFFRILPDFYDLNKNSTKTLSVFLNKDNPKRAGFFLFYKTTEI